ncbi:ExeA family protein [Rhodovulum sp. DZ06]|uniref:ExeA family protein n=1 Tax=Rhodovulum sp. DZ06 TaxID=3425126 RepID=UPI003D340686
MRDLSRMYLEHFGLKERPFTLVPDPEFLFWARPHSKAYTMLEYGIASHAPITVITGEVGAGKTTLLRRLLSEIPDEYSIGLISNATGGRGELLHWVMMSLGQDVPQGATYVQAFRQFQDFLVDEYRQGRRTALIFDEAQNLQEETLEELRMFSNINADKDELLQLILVGQPELRELVHRPHLSQFAQRIASEFHLRALNEGETKGYIDHRLTVAGAERQVFDEDACILVHAACRGVPRLINQLCDYALVYAFAEELDMVDAGVVREVLEDRREFGVFSDPDVVLGPNAPQARPRAPKPAPGEAAAHQAAPDQAALDQAGQPPAPDAPAAPQAQPGGAPAADGAPPQDGTAPGGPGPDGTVDENVFYGIWGERKV